MHTPSPSTHSFSLEEFQADLQSFWKWKEYFCIEYTTPDCEYEVFIRKFPYIARYFSYKNMKYHVHILWKLERFLEKMSQYKNKIALLPASEQEAFRRTLRIYSQKFTNPQMREIYVICEKICFSSSVAPLSSSVRQKVRGVFGI